MPPRVATFAELPDLVLRSRIPEDPEAAVIGVAAGFADLVPERAPSRARSDVPAGAPRRSVPAPSPKASPHSSCTCSSNVDSLEPHVLIGPPHSRIRLSPSGIEDERTGARASVRRGDVAGNPRCSAGPAIPDRTGPDIAGESGLRPRPDARRPGVQPVPPRCPPASAGPAMRRCRMRCSPAANRFRISHGSAGAGARRERVAGGRNRLGFLTGSHRRKEEFRC
ncbi:hypothetical protein NG2371_06920 [Nocardia gamkensis]|nr:hypothetical protein [Nocardia gamkensis]